MGSRIKQNPETTFEVYVEVAYPRTGGTLSDAGPTGWGQLMAFPGSRCCLLEAVSGPILRCRGNSRRTTVTRKFYRL